MKTASWGVVCLLAYLGYTECLRVGLSSSCVCCSLDVVYMCTRAWQLSWLSQLAVGFERSLGWADSGRDFLTVVLRRRGVMKLTDGRSDGGMFTCMATHVGGTETGAALITSMHTTSNGLNSIEHGCFFKMCVAGHVVPSSISKLMAW